MTSFTAQELIVSEGRNPMTKLSELTTAQISEAFSAAKMLTAARRHGDVFNQLRAGQLSQVVGTLKAGASGRTHKDARRMLRKALRAQGVEI